MAVENLSVRCCIAGGGPAGMMLCPLLARAVDCMPRWYREGKLQTDDLAAVQRRREFPARLIGMGVRAPSTCG